MNNLGFRHEFSTRNFDSTQNLGQCFLVVRYMLQVLILFWYVFEELEVLKSKLFYEKYGIHKKGRNKAKSGQFSHRANCVEHLRSKA